MNDQNAVKDFATLPDDASTVHTRSLSIAGILINECHKIRNC